MSTMEGNQGDDETNGEELTVEEFEKTIDYISIKGNNREYEIRKALLISVLKSLHAYGNHDTYNPIGNTKKNTIEILEELDMVSRHMKGFSGEVDGWSDNDGQCRELYKQLTTKEYTYHLKLDNRKTVDKFDTRHEAIGESSILNRRNPDVDYTIDNEYERV